MIKTALDLAVEKIREIEDTYRAEAIRLIRTGNDMDRIRSGILTDAAEKLNEAGRRGRYVAKAQRDERAAAAALLGVAP